MEQSTAPGKTKRRTAVSLPELDHRLTAYALAAGAALAVAPSAHAGIVYIANPTSNQPGNTLTVSGVSANGSLGNLQFFTVTGLGGLLPNNTPLFSLNVQGSLYGPSSAPSFAALTLLAYGLPRYPASNQPSNFILAASNPYFRVAKVAPGFFIGPGVGCSCTGSLGWTPAGPMARAVGADYYYGPHLDGEWANGVGLMAFSFGSFSSYFFGWARFQVISDTSPSITIKLIDYAYEDQPGVGIVAGQAPEPGSLGLLALGFAGMAAWRARRKAA